MWVLTKAWAGLLSPLCWLLGVFPFPEVMTGAMAAPHLSTGAAWSTWSQLAPPRPGLPATTTTTTTTTPSSCWPQKKTKKKQTQSTQACEG